MFLFVITFRNQVKTCFPFTEHCPCVTLCISHRWDFMTHDRYRVIACLSSSWNLHCRPYLKLSMAIISILMNNNSHIIYVNYVNILKKMPDPWCTTTGWNYLNVGIAQETQTVYMEIICPNILLHYILMNRGNMSTCSRLVYSVCTTKHIRQLQFTIYYSCLCKLCNFREEGMLGYCLMTVIILRPRLQAQGTCTTTWIIFFHPKVTLR